jgi:hypothetical protein
MAALSLLQITLDAVASGAYSDSTHIAAPARSAGDNYIAGWFAMTTPAFEYRNFFVFDLSAVTDSIVAAELRVFNPISDLTPNEMNTLRWFDVTTDPATVIASTGSVDIFNDLGSGTSYGTLMYPRASSGVVLSTTLNGAAIAALNGARGRTFAIGGAVQNLVGGSTLRIPMKEIACSDPMSIRIRAQRSWQFHGDGLIDISQEKWVIGTFGSGGGDRTSSIISFLHSAHFGPGPFSGRAACASTRRSARCDRHCEPTDP